MADFIVNGSSSNADKGPRGRIVKQVAFGGGCYVLLRLEKKGHL